MRHRFFTAVLIYGFALTIARGAAAPSAGMGSRHPFATATFSSVAPRRAADFANSQGMNAAACEGSAERTADLMYLPILWPQHRGHIRIPAGDASCDYTLVQNELTQYGFDATLLTATNLDPMTAVAPVVKKLSLPPYAIEGPNEPPYPQPSVVPYMASLRQAFPNYTVLGPAVVPSDNGRSEQNVKGIAPYISAVTTHYYNGGRQPETPPYGGVFPPPCQNYGYGTVLANVCEAEIDAPHANFPWVVTEIGTGTNNYYCGSAQADSRVQNPYTQREYLYAFSLGSKLTQVYKFLDGFLSVQGQCGDGFDSEGLVYRYPLFQFRMRPANRVHLLRA